MGDSTWWQAQCLHGTPTRAQHPGGSICIKDRENSPLHTPLSITQDIRRHLSASLRQRQTYSSVRVLRCQDWSKCGDTNNGSRTASWCHRGTCAWPRAIHCHPALAARHLYNMCPPSCTICTQDNHMEERGREYMCVTCTQTSYCVLYWGIMQVHPLYTHWYTLVGSVCVGGEWGLCNRCEYVAGKNEWQSELGPWWICGPFVMLCPKFFIIHKVSLMYFIKGSTIHFIIPQPNCIVLFAINVKFSCFCCWGNEVV